MFRYLPDAGKFKIFSVNLNSALRRRSNGKHSLAAARPVLIHRNPDAVQPATVNIVKER